MTTWLPAGTTKTMFVVRADPAPLRAAALRDEMVGAGAVRVQLNVDDEHVAPALRLATAAPVSAVLSVWSDPAHDPAGVAAVVADAVGATSGWVVDERRRLDPAERYDGARAEELANVAVLRRPADLDRETWLRRWLVEHTGVAIRTQATTGYVQNICTAPLGTPAPADERVEALVEELFPAAAVRDVHAFYGSGGDDAELGRRLEQLMASVARMGADRDLDLVPSSRHLWDLADVPGLSRERPATPSSR